MSKYVVMSREEIETKILELLSTQKLKSDFLAEIKRKLEELKAIFKGSIENESAIAKLTSSYMHNDKDKTINVDFEESRKLGRIIEHYVHAYVGHRALANLGWEFNLEPETFHTLQNLNKDEVAKDHAKVLRNYFDGFLKVKNELKMETKIRTDGFFLDNTIIIAGLLTNLIYTLLGSNQYLITNGYFDKFENEFFSIESKDEQSKFEESETLCTIRFKNQNVLDLLNAHFKTVMVNEPISEDDFL